MNTGSPPGNTGECHYSRPSSPFPQSLVTDEKTSNAQTHTHAGHIGSVGHALHNDTVSPSRALPIDLAEEIEGMYRLLDLISDSGSNGCGNEGFRIALPAG
jgi:hypothetical protein